MTGPSSSFVENINPHLVLLAVRKVEEGIWPTLPHPVAVGAHRYLSIAMDEHLGSLMFY